MKHAKKDLIPGGLADDIDPDSFDPEQLAAGIEVELEHTSDRAIAEEIARDHLTEDPEYYIKLRQIEKSLIQADIEFEKAKPATIGEIHHWASGDYRKEAHGWSKVKNDIKQRMKKLHEDRLKREHIAEHERKRSALRRAALRAKDEGDQDAADALEEHVERQDDRHMAKIERYQSQVQEFLGGGERERLMREADEKVAPLEAELSRLEGENARLAEIMDDPEADEDAQADAEAESAVLEVKMDKLQAQIDGIRDRYEDRAAAIEQAAHTRLNLARDESIESNPSMDGKNSVVTEAHSGWSSGWVAKVDLMPAAKMMVLDRQFLRPDREQISRAGNGNRIYNDLEDGVYEADSVWRSFQSHRVYFMVRNGEISETTSSIEQAKAWVDPEYKSKDAALSQAMQKENAAAAETAKAEGWPTLAGSAKQIAWAESIRAKKIQEIDTIIDSNSDPSKREAMAESRRIIMDRFRHASSWIDSRYDSPESLLSWAARLTPKQSSDAVEGLKWIPLHSL